MRKQVKAMSVFYRSSIAVLACGCLLVSLVLAREESEVSTYWVEFQLKDKGEDYLFVVDPPVPKADAIQKEYTRRRFRCRTHVPTFVREISSTTTGTDRVLIGKVSGIKRLEESGASIDDVEILCLTIVDKKSLKSFSPKDDRFEELVPMKEKPGR